MWSHRVGGKPGLGSSGQYIVQNHGLFAPLRLEILGGEVFSRGSLPARPRSIVAEGRDRARPCRRPPFRARSGGQSAVDPKVVNDAGGTKSVAVRLPRGRGSRWNPVGHAGSRWNEWSKRSAGLRAKVAFRLVDCFASCRVQILSPRLMEGPDSVRETEWGQGLRLFALGLSR
jgi:hypothetical protein